MHYQINAFGGAAHEDAFLRLACVDESFDLFAGAFVSSGGLHAQIVDAAMNVGMFVLEIGAAALDHDLRHLRRRSVVEIHQRLPVYSLSQHREVFADAIDVPVNSGNGTCYY